MFYMALQFENCYATLKFKSLLCLPGPINIVGQTEKTTSNIMNVYDWEKRVLSFSLIAVENPKIIIMLPILVPKLEYSLPCLSIQCINIFVDLNH